MDENSFMQNIVAFIGRALISFIFIFIGITRLLRFTSTADLITTAGIPCASCILILAILVEVGGGLMVLFGWKTRFGAFLLCLFIIPITFIRHAFWASELADVQNQMDHFLKNFAILGATLYIMAYGAGAFSLDAWSKKFGKKQLR